MTDEKELTVEWSDQVKEQAAADPGLTEALREIGAIFRQAQAGVKSGQYETFDDAMFILTGNRPEKVSEEETEELEAEFQRLKGEKNHDH